MTKGTAPRNTYNKLKCDMPGGDYHNGRITPEELVEVVSHRSVARICVSTESFGLVEVDRDVVLRKFSDEYFKRSCEIVSEKMGGRPVEVNVTIYPVKHLRYEAYGVLVHTVGAWHDGKIMHTW